MEFWSQSNTSDVLYRVQKCCDIYFFKNSGTHVNAVFHKMENNVTGLIIRNMVTAKIMKVMFGSVKKLELCYQERCCNNISE
jgi:hypothetical protein